MQGKILDYNNELKSGLIRGEDGNKYRFSIDDCKSTIIPKVGADVDFDTNGDKAVEVYILDQKTDQANTVKSEPTKPINQETHKNIVQTVKKIVIWLIAIITGIMLISFLVAFTQAKNEDTKIRELRNGCANNDAKACYELGISDFFGSSLNSEETVGLDEKNEALAKGCQLGNKDACYKGMYYERGCELKDGESCYEVGRHLPSNLNIGIAQSITCGVSPKSDGCEEINRISAVHTKKYNKLACEYGYSQGCL